MTMKTDSVTEKQVSDSDTTTGINYNDSAGWRNLPEIGSTLEESDTCDTDEREWEDNSFYRQVHSVSNLEYAKLKLSSFAVKLLDCKPITALFDTWATCSCILYHLFTKISGKVDMTQISLQVNIGSGTTLGPIGIVQVGPS